MASQLETKETHQNQLHKVFELQSLDQFDLIMASAAASAMQGAFFPLSSDFEFVDSQYVLTIRTEETEKKKQRVQATLLLGLIEATRARLAALFDASPELRSMKLEEYGITAKKIAEELLQDFLAKPKLFTQFSEYYSGG